MNLKNKISTQEQFYIEQGKAEYEFFTNDVKEALLNNTFGDNFFFYSPPGYSKTFTTNQIAQQFNIPLVKFEGGVGYFAFCADVATTLLAAPKDDSKIYCLFDDCDSLINSKGDTLNSIKALFDPDRKVLAYRKMLTSQYHSLDDTQKAALDHFREEGRSGFSIPVDRFVFITLSNTPLSTADDIENATASKKQHHMDLAAIRRRIQYKDVVFNPGVDWGYCANILINSNLAERWKPDITDEEKLEILKFTSPTNNWFKMTERNISVFDKMVKDMVRFPDYYYDRWISQYLKK